MATWTLTRQQDNEWHCYELHMAGVLVATAKWRSHGQHAEIHNLVHHCTLASLRACRDVFTTEIRPDIRASGCTMLMALSDGYDEKMSRYWRLMGFTTFLAAMEV